MSRSRRGNGKTRSGVSFDQRNFVPNGNRVTPSKTHGKRYNGNLVSGSENLVSANE